MQVVHYQPSAENFLFWWSWLGLNQQPGAYKATALPIELHDHFLLNFTQVRLHHTRGENDSQSNETISSVLVQNLAPPEGLEPPT